MAGKGYHGGRAVNIPKKPSIPEQEYSGVHEYKDGNTMAHDNKTDVTEQKRKLSIHNEQARILASGAPVHEQLIALIQLGAGKSTRSGRRRAKVNRA